MNMEKVILAVDIGGTKVAVGVVTTEGEILATLVEPTLQKGPAAGIQQITTLLEKVEQKADLKREQILGIGIGIPAVLERETDFIIWGPNLSGWRNVDLRGALANHFSVPVFIEYDGHTAILGEWWKGAARDYASAVSIIIGTGVGGGLVLEGSLIRGVSRLAGAVGWFSIDRGMEIDEVKAKALGSWEAQVAGPGITRRTKDLLNKSDRPSSLRNLKKEISVKDIFAASLAGDELAQQITDETADLIGVGIANVVSIVNPEIVILGGSVGSNSGFMQPKITIMLERYAQPISSRAVKLVTSQLGADAGLLGAAYSVLLRSK